MDLKQQIKIDRLPWIIAGILVVAVVLIGTPVSSGQLEITTVYIVRHAEKKNNSANTPLSVAGESRAEELARVLGDEGIDVVFVTDFTRTRQTGKPVAVPACSRSETVTVRLSASPPPAPLPRRKTSARPWTA